MLRMLMNNVAMLEFKYQLVLNIVLACQYYVVTDSDIR